MRAQLRNFIPQPLVAIVACLLASALLIGARERLETVFDVTHPWRVFPVFFLMAAIAAAGITPIHVRHNIKVVLTTVPIFCATMLLSPFAAALTAGSGMLLLEILTRSQRGNTVSDIATSVSRWVIVALVCATVTRQAMEMGLPLALILPGVAVLMFVGDIVTGALEIAPMSGESPSRVIRVLFSEAGVSEAVQYLLGTLAVLAALQEPWSLLLWILPLAVVNRSFKHAKEMHDGTSRLLESLADAIDLRDPYTGGHSRRVTEYALRILAEMNMTGPEVELIRSAARVHDIGKIGIPDRVLNKPDRLTPEEKAIMDSHSTRGAELVARYKDFARGMHIVRHHHESWDGSGYPDGLKGLDIPFGARVVAVADSFDAMTSDRPYRAGMPVSVAARILREGRGRQWDAAIVDAFLRTLEIEQPTPQVETPIVA